MSSLQPPPDSAPFSVGERDEAQDGTVGETRDIASAEEAVQDVTPPETGGGDQDSDEPEEDDEVSQEGGLGVHFSSPNLGRSIGPWEGPWQ